MAWMMWHAAPDRRLPGNSAGSGRRSRRPRPDDPEAHRQAPGQRYKSADEALSDLKIDIKLVRTGEESADNLGKPPETGGGNRRLLVIAALAVSVIMSLVVAFYPGGGGTPAPPIQSQAIVGTVRDVLASEDKLVIIYEDGRPDEVPIGKKPRIRLDGGSYILLRELLPKDRVEIRFEETGDVRTANIAALRPSESTGKIKEVDPANSKITATLEADPHPQDVPMYVPAGAKLVLNAREVGVGDLLPDDRVRIAHLKDTKGRAPREVIRLDALRTVSMTGFVHEVIHQDGRFQMDVSHLRTLTRIEFAADCRISINGQTEEEGKKYAPVDLKKGDRVEVRYDVSATAVVADRHESLTGVTLLEIVPANREIRVQPDNDVARTLVVGEDCQITREEKKATFAELSKDDVLDITFEPQQDAAGAVRTINARKQRRN